MKMLKKLSLLLFGLVSCFALVDNANAAETKEVCEDYTNYHFLSTISEATEHNKNISATGGWVTKFQTTGPELAIDGLNVSTDTENAPKVSSVCLVRNMSDTSPCENFSGNYEKMTLNDYYTYYLQTLNNGTLHTYVDPNSTSTNKVTKSYIYSDANDKTTRYISHGKWYSINESTGTLTEVDESADLSDISVNKMVNASALPYKLSIMYDSSIDIINNPITIVVGRTITEAYSNNNLTSFKLLWPQNNANEETDVILSPALYKIEYKVCKNETVYDATIKYVDAETNKEVADTWTKGSLIDGYSDKITSPTIKNCTPNKDVVDVSINASDFNAVVKYTCVTENPKTGSIFIAGIVVLMFASLGYMIYYSRYKNVDEV